MTSQEREATGHGATASAVTQRSLPTPLTQGLRGGVGDSPVRPDARLKVRGEFAYSSDLWMENMLWGTTLRSPHPYARIRSIDISPALKLPGVRCVLTAEDVPGVKFYGNDHPDQPVLAMDVVRYQGEPVAIIAADHPETGRRAAKLIEVDYEVLEPLTDPRRAILDESAPHLHEGGNIVRHQPVRVGDPDNATADVVVTAEYEVGMQDQAFLGPESGLAVPAEDGGVDLYIATQWIHNDLWLVAPCLGLPEDKVRMTQSGVGGAFGGREDLSVQIHACMLALHTGRPVKMMYNREESFFGHVHRHPALMRYEHGANRDGKLVYAKAEIILDGGAYASTTPAVVGNAASLGIGPYEVPHIKIDAWGTYTNNPPCGAMRGFGAVQACFAYESQMDAMAAKLGLSPVEFRRRNAVSQGSALATGQVIDSPAPLAEMLTRLEAMELPRPVDDDGYDLRGLPGGVANTTHGEGVKRGVGYGVGIKNICFSEGFDDYSTARVRLEVIGGEPVALVHTAGVEVGQGLVTLEAQIARTELGVEQVTIVPADTQVGSAGSSSASRQSYMTGGAVRQACLAVRAVVAERVGSSADEITLTGGKIVSATRGVIGALAEILGDSPIEQTREFRHRPTQEMDPVTGQGDSHTQLALCVHRAVVDVDVDLGLVKVVDLAAVQDVGKILNRLSLEGQIHGGTAQGLGLAVMEEILVTDGKVRNPSFTDYLIPTILDMPPMRMEILEYPDPNAPYGLRGAGEPPTLSSTPAIAAAIRDATGLRLPRVPIRPEHITNT
ncbi:xanthine dehydrogenase subunit D [Stackebrandtia nassauensis]|uniref:Xanthine dehydrogenase D subunit n=1 Tax=Stackebrandtia nassauensis (strain DSM 44728 / CIP 108903 / NRRL B-16338 / NBRC 102104 / LLR-40K-21) TaxID=446470 RepID=D3Q648_STANL|nr:xanthine dehydrogenase subunit D [Stackebrandtia nassauensis]ADD42223.1 xanthine dehydrogenase D subunit [Stackebrandtia nassauensis DSM 44728]